MYRVLVADDEKIERMMLCKTLQDQVGDICVIYEAKNGREAVEIFEKEKIQIAILDIEMPGINGLEAAKIMRKQEERCVIFFMTAYDEFAYAKQAISVKALDYLLKPYDEKELIFVMEEAMHQVEKNYKEDNFMLETEKPDISAEEILHEDNLGEVRLALAREIIENYIKNHFMENISMHNLAQEMNYSDAHFCKLFKHCFRLNFTTYLAEYRMEMAKKMLENPAMNIKDIGVASGYTDSNYFTRVFKRITGYTPTEYRAYIANNKTK